MCFARHLPVIISFTLFTGLMLMAMPPSGYAEEERVIKIEESVEDLVLTDDISIAEAQAKAYPDNPEAHFLLAIAYSRSPYVEKAFLSAKQAKKVMKNSEEGYANLDAKLAEYQDMLTYRVDDPLVLYRLGFAYFLKGYGIEKGYIKNTEEQPQTYYNKAEETLRYLISKYPDDIWAMNYLGFLLVDIDEEKNLDEAISLWKQSAAIEDNNPGAYMLLGEAFLKKGDLKQGATYAAKGLKERMLWND